MVDADELHGIIDMIDEVFDRGGRIARVLESVVTALDSPDARVPMDALYLAMILAATEPSRIS